VREPARCLANRSWRPSISLFDPSLGALLAPLCSLIERVERRVFVFDSTELVTFLVGASVGVHSTGFSGLAGGRDHHAGPAARALAVAGCTAAARAGCPLDATAAAARGHAWPLLSCTVSRPGALPLPFVPCGVHLAALTMAAPCSLPARTPLPVVSRVLTSGHSGVWTLPRLACPRFSAPVSPARVGRF
jgi:hypothetical protein